MTKKQRNTNTNIGNGITEFSLGKWLLSSSKRKTNSYSNSSGFENEEEIRNCAFVSFAEQ